MAPQRCDSVLRRTIRRRSLATDRQPRDAESLARNLH
jgi:hypothetical protein